MLAFDHGAALKVHSRIRRVSRASDIGDSSAADRLTCLCIRDKMKMFGNREVQSETRCKVREVSYRITRIEKTPRKRGVLPLVHIVRVAPKLIVSSGRRTISITGVGDSGVHRSPGRSDGRGSSSANFAP